MSREPYDVIDRDSGKVRVLSRRCGTCIFRRDGSSPVTAERAEQVIDHNVSVGALLTCHSTLPYGPYPEFDPAVCAGFWARHGHQTGAGRIAEKLLGVVRIAPPSSTAPAVSAAEAALSTATTVRSRAMQEPNESPCPPWCVTQHDARSNPRLHATRIGQVEIGGQRVRVEVERKDHQDLSGGWIVYKPPSVRMDAYPAADLEELTPSQATALAKVVDLLSLHEIDQTPTSRAANQLANLLDAAAAQLVEPAVPAPAEDGSEK